jgi:hypothetical protein
MDLVLKRLHPGEGHARTIAASQEAGRDQDSAKTRLTSPRDLLARRESAFRMSVT